jgi:hypothetical protein
MKKWAYITFATLVCNNLVKCASFVTPGTGIISRSRCLPKFSRAIWHFGIADDDEDHEDASSLPSSSFDNEMKISSSETQNDFNDIPELPRGLLIFHLLSLYPFGLCWLSCGLSCQTYFMASLMLRRT